MDCHSFVLLILHCVTVHYCAHLVGAGVRIESVYRNVQILTTKQKIYATTHVTGIIVEVSFHSVCPTETKCGILVVLR